MGKFSFHNWLSLRENTHVVEIQVARFLEDILDKAVALKKQDMAQGHSLPFSQYARQVWPQDAVKGHDLVLPGTFPPDIAGQPVRFSVEPGNNLADTIHDNGKFGGFIINMMAFNYAKTPEDVDKHLESLKSTMHHEAEHIYNVGEKYDANDHEGDEKNTKAMQYMSHPGEIRAHARQMAHVYAKHFPGEPFDLHKAQSLLDTPGLTTTHKNYFGSLAKPDVWQKNVQKYGYRHENPHDQIVGMVPHFLAQYQ